MSTTCPVCNSTINASDASCPSCGFKLHGSTEEFQPIPLEGETQPPTSGKQKAASKATLTVVRGPQIGTIYRLDDKRQSIGRSPQCDIFLNDMSVSRVHASIVPHSGSFLIEDRQSYNGIWVNNESVEQKQLEVGDIVQVGAFCLEYSE